MLFPLLYSCHHLSIRTNRRTCFVFKFLCDLTQIVYDKEREGERKGEKNHLQKEATNFFFLLFFYLSHSSSISTFPIFLLRSFLIFAYVKKKEHTYTYRKKRRNLLFMRTRT